MALPAKQERYTFADILAWEEGENIEIIDGEALMMATPSSQHQEISMEFARQLANFLVGKQCKVYPAPFGVRLFERDGDRPEDVDTVVEPDGGMLKICEDYGREDVAKVRALDGCFIELDKVFPE